ncbi:MAG: hypothetical protein EXS43_13535 [Opitutus sp.]|nr:hypothetical protein [Opitutus sp.]
MSPLDFGIVICYLVGVTALGLIASRSARKTLDDYFLGNRAIPWLVSAASLIATGISCRSLIGMPGLTYKGDLTYLQMYLPLPFTVLIAAWIFLPFYVRFRMTSVYEYLGLRFNNRVRSFASILFQIQTAMITGTVIAAPSLVLSEVTGISYEWSVVVLLFLTLLYTAMGGTKAIIWTDMLQLTIFAGVPFAILIYVCTQADGGVVNLLRVAEEQGKLRLFDFTFDLGTEVTFWSALLSMSCWHLANFSVNQENSQRYLTAPSEKDCARTMVWGSVGILAIWVMLMLIGVLLFAYNTLHPGVVPANVAADRVFPAFVLSALPSGFKGLFISAALAAGMATLASMVNAMGTASLLDVWKLHRDDGASETTWIQRARLLTLFWGVVSFGAAFVVLKLGTVITAGIKLGAVMIGAIFGMFILGIFFRRGTAAGAVVGAVVGIVTLVIVLLTSKISWAWYCLIGTVVSVVVGYAVSVLSPLPADARPLTWWELPPAK